MLGLMFELNVNICIQMHKYGGRPKQSKHSTLPTSPHWLTFSSDMRPSMCIGAMFWKQIHHNRDDEDKGGPRNVGEFQPFNMADGLRRFY
jgi:hypothetical protein